MDFEKVAGANGITTFRKWVLPPRRALRAPLGTQPSHLDFGNRVLSMGGSYIFEKIGNADRSSLPPVTLQKLQPKTRFGAKTLEKCVLSTTHVLELLAPEAPPKAPSRCGLLKSAREINENLLLVALARVRARALARLPPTGEGAFPRRGEAPVPEVF